MRFQCRCVWQGVQCEADATQEDGKCDWCGERTEEQLRASDAAIIAPDGTFLGLGGGAVTPYNHQAGRGPIPADKVPSACWINGARDLSQGEN